MPFHAKYGAEERRRALERVALLAEQGSGSHAVATVAAEAGISRTVLYGWLCQQRAPAPPPRPAMDGAGAARALARVVVCGVCQRRVTCVTTPAGGLYYVCRVRCPRRRAVPAGIVVAAIGQAVATRTTGALGCLLPGGPDLAATVALVRGVRIGKLPTDIRIAWHPSPPPADQPPAERGSQDTGRPQP